MLLPLPLVGDHVKLKELGVDNSQDPKCKLDKNKDADNSTKKSEKSNKGAFSWAIECCLMSPTKYTDLGVTIATPKQHTISQVSSFGFYLFIQHLCLCFIFNFDIKMVF